MGKKMKRHLAVFFSTLLVLSAVLEMLPQPGTETWAGIARRAPMVWARSSGKPRVPGKMTVEQGQKFYIGDYLDVCSTWETASMVKAAYATSRDDIATVDSKGCVETIAVGTTVIGVTYKGYTAKCRLKVVEAGSLGTNADYTKLSQAAEEIAGAMPSKVTADNGFDLLKKVMKYKEVAESVEHCISEIGYLQEADEHNEMVFYVTKELAVPQAGRYRTLDAMLKRYGDKVKSFSPKAKSISAKTNKITIKLKKAPTKAQVLSIKIHNRGLWQENSRNSDKCCYSVSLTNTRNKRDSCTGFVYLSKGSKTMTILPKKSKKGKDVNTKLKKGVTYWIGGQEGEHWQTVKVK